jgi:DNA-binding NarL/FixJ family response regulator
MTGAMTGGAADAPPAVAPPTRVLLADDQDLVRAGLRMMVDSAPDLTVVGEAATGRQAVRLARLERADVVLMDIRMPELDGLAATRQITADESLAGVKILILTTFEVDEYVFTVKKEDLELCNSRSVRVRRQGLEPRTRGLRVRCSAS